MLNLNMKLGKMNKEFFQRFFDLVWVLALRDIKIRYQLSILGLYWAVLNPLLIALIYGFVFNKIFKAQGIENVPYVVFLFCGISFWGLFSNSLTSAVNCLTGNASMLSKVSFPRIILPTASVLARLVDFLFSFLIIVVLMIYFKVRVNFSIVYLPILLILHLLFTLGLSYIFSALNVLYRDISQIINVVLMLWLYLSPVFYSVGQIPMNLEKFFILNPIGQIVQLEVKSLIGQEAPNIIELLIVGLPAILVFIIGLNVFKYYENIFSEVM